MSKMPRSADMSDSQEDEGSWDAFERAVDVVVKAPPQHRASKSPAKSEGIREGGPPVGKAKQKRAPR